MAAWRYEISYAYAEGHVLEHFHFAPSFFMEVAVWYPILIKFLSPPTHTPSLSKVIEINKPRGDLIIMEQISCHITTLISLLAGTTKSQRYRAQTLQSSDRYWPFRFQERHY